MRCRGSAEFPTVDIGSAFPRFSGGRLDAAHLAAAQVGIRRQVEDVKHELVDGVAADPEEDVLAVLDQEQAVPFEALRRERQRVREDDALLRDGAALYVVVAVYQFR